MKAALPLVYWRKTGSEILMSFMVSFCFFFIVFLINQVLLFAEDILSKGADLLSVAKLLFYSLPTVIAISVPFSVLAATLMTSSRQHADNEFMAASTLGIHPALIYVPFLIIGIVISAASFLTNDWFMPRASNGFRNVYAELIHRAARVELTPYSVLKYGNRTIATGAGDGDSLRDVLISDQDNQPDSTTMAARRVRIGFTRDRLDALLSLEGILEQKALPGSSARGDFAITSAEAGEIRIRIQEPMANFGGTSPSEMSAASLSRQIAEKQKRIDARIRDREEQKATVLDRLRLSYGISAAMLESTAAYNAYRSLSSQTVSYT
ncbi:MAG: LptF/LptG family permease, partial [Rectinema sp.]|nr:LptF/LptG family permease [Rectinema sp.]